MMAPPIPKPNLPSPEAPAAENIESCTRKCLSAREKEDIRGIAKQNRRCAQVGLAAWNKSQRSQQEPEYCLVKPLDSSGFKDEGKLWYHANFKARPKNNRHAKPELFFVEVKGNIYGIRGHKVTKVCVLTSSDSATPSINGCMACRMVCHPEGGFNVGRYMYTVAD